MVNELPSNVSYGTVVGRFLLAYADGVDVDSNPDGVAAQGTVLFTPSAAYIKNVTGSGANSTIIPATIECSLNADGYIVGPDGNQGVRLIATDDPDNNPVDWTWRVDLRLTSPDGTPVRTAQAFHIEIPGGTTTDLSVASPVQAANGTFYTVGPTGPATSLSIGSVTTGAAGSSATASITGEAPNQTLSLTIPQGLQGIQGIQGVQGIQGETGAVGPTGATGINWQGAWSSSVDYTDNDAVFYNNASWFASGNPTLGEVPSAESLHWFPLALQGATGATGPQGPQGETGPIGPQGPAGDLGNLTGSGPITYANAVIGFDDSLIIEIDGGTV